MNRILFFAVLICCLPAVGCTQRPSTDVTATQTFRKMNSTKTATVSKIDTATFAAGCFWCVEAQFKELKGVKKVVSGFSGGTVANPSYREVCTGTTGHAEACNIVYDPSVISYDELLAAFFVSHDPTQLNRQGNDVGTQYRSDIFYHNAAQKKAAEYYIQQLDKEHAFSSPIVTRVDPYLHFYPAENYHQDYYALHGEEPYCSRVIGPEVERFKKVFKNKIK